jgi:hypothetical protein
MVDFFDLMEDSAENSNSAVPHKRQLLIESFIQQHSHLVHVGHSFRKYYRTSIEVHRRKILEVSDPFQIFIAVTVITEQVYELFPRIFQDLVNDGKNCAVSVL